VKYCQAHGLNHEVIHSGNYKDYVGKSCDLLINADGNSVKHLAIEDPLEEFDRSVRSVRASLADIDAQIYVYLSSCDVYTDCSSPELTKEDARLIASEQSSYGFHKSLAEECVRHAANRWLIIRPGGFVGPGLRKNAIFDLLQGGPLWLNPGSALQYLHTDDAARIVFRLVDQGSEGEVFNVCGDGVIELNEVIEYIGQPVEFSAGSPTVLYDVSIEKLGNVVRVPSTRETVLDFVRDQLRKQTVSPGQ